MTAGSTLTNWGAVFEQLAPWMRDARARDTCDTRDTQIPEPIAGTDTLDVALDTRRPGGAVERDTIQDRPIGCDTKNGAQQNASSPVSNVSRVSSVTGDDNVARGLGPVRVRGFDPFEERAAVLQHDAGMDRRTAERGAVAELLFDWIDDPPLLFGDTPPRALAQFFEDAKAFIRQGWLPKAEALGWELGDIAGADPDRPYARLDRAGLLWAINGDRLISISDKEAVITTRTGARQVFRRPSACRG